MPIRVVCPEGHKILAPSKRAGQKIRCPRCRSELTVPAPEEEQQLAETIDSEIAPPPKTTPETKSTKKQPTKKPATKTGDRWKGQPKGKSKKTDAKQEPTSPRLTPPPLPAARQKAADSPAPPAEKPSSQPPAKAQAKPSGPPPPPSKPKTEPAAKPAEQPPAASQQKPSAEQPTAEQPAAKKEQPPAEPPPPPPPSQGPVAPQPPPPPAPPVAEQGRAGPPAEVPAESEADAQAAAEPAVPAIGVRHRPERVRGVMWLAGVLAALALFSFAPAILETYDYILSEGDQPLARWAWFAIGLSGLQLAYAIYLAQLPDWSTVWVAAIAALGTAMAYAMLYAVTLLGDADSALLAWLQIHATQTGKASGWCFVMLSLNGMFAYFCGRTGAGWRNTEALRASIGLK